MCMDPNRVGQIATQQQQIAASTGSTGSAQTTGGPQGGGFIQAGNTAPAPSPDGGTGMGRAGFDRIQQVWDATTTAPGQQRRSAINRSASRQAATVLGAPDQFSAGGNASTKQKTLLGG